MSAFNQWQPMEAAPKDGTEILVCFKYIGVKCVAWVDSDGDSDGKYALWSVDDNKFDPRPLRGYCDGDELGWMPLPEPPKSEGKS